jgi:hypothetical protein
LKRKGNVTYPVKIDVTFSLEHDPTTEVRMIGEKIHIDIKYLERIEMNLDKIISMYSDNLHEHKL